ncbi:MAG TPA: protein kinase [Planctomycetota bacterium]|nr:protein kinase [Planctomycetota bacterium]
MPYATDGLVGKLALQKGMITASQLKDCLAEQAALQKAGQKRPLGVIMVGKGLMNDEALLDLLEEQKRVLAERSNFTQVRRDDFLFGQILLKQGVATSSEINEALRIQAEAAERGEMAVPRLGQILIEMGVTEEKDIQRTLKLQYKTLYECPGCLLKYNLVEASGEKQYRCKKCDAILLPKPPGTGLKADESAYGMALEVASDLPAEVAQAELDPSNQFGKYILVRPLGRGGSGVVHLAYQKELKRFIALKLLRGNEDPETLQRFTAEAQLAARLRHPNIVSVYEIGKHLNVPYIALEYVDGVALDQRGRLPIRKACQLMRDVAGAVHAAHEWGVIHRDLKPQNILLDRKDRPVVTDFGLAREVSAARELTEHGIVVGTPAYMSVEQATGERALDGRSDVASLGAVFYELLTGRTPYTGKTPVDIALAVINQTPIKPRALIPDLSPALEAICLKAMAKRREERYPTARALAEDLQRFLEGEAVEARPQGKLSRTVRRLARNKSTTLMAAAAIAVIAVAGVVVFSMRRDSRRTTDLLEARTLENSGRLPEALRIYEQIPMHAEVERVRGILRIREEEAKDAQDRERAAGVLSEIGGDPGAADRVTIATRALEIYPGLEQAYVIRALARQDLGDDASAYSDLGLALKVSKSPLPHYLGRADIARRLGLIEDEIANLSAALELTPFSADLRIHRSWANARLARKLADSSAPEARIQAQRALESAEADLATVKRHSLLETVQGAVKEAQVALHKGS